MEINTRYALTAADEAHMLKLAIKETAALHGLVATFIGRPTEGGGTSGYHLLSAWDGEKNVFDEPDSGWASPTRPAGSWAASSTMRGG